MNRFAVNGYGAPRVPRVYCPWSWPFFTSASSFVPYSSKLSSSRPFASCPDVEVTFSSPLKNAPLTLDPDPAISNRNGTSIVPLSCPADTTTDASQRPASDCARAGEAETIAASAAAATSGVTLMTPPEKQTGPESVELPGPAA